MGNCLGVQEQIVRSKEIEYKSALMVHEVSPEVTQHQAVSDTTYKQSKTRKKVRFSEPEVEEGENTGLRVKLVISKQKLKEMIASGVVSIEGMVSEMVHQNQQNEVQHVLDCDRNGPWKPFLKTIPEVEC